MKLALPPGSIARLVRRAGRLVPLALLLAQILASYQFMLNTERLKLHRLADTPSYQKGANLTTVRDLLTHHRTMGYPAFLRFLHGIGHDWQKLPRAHAAVYFAAVVLFFLALAAYSGSAWLGLAAATPLVWAQSLVFLPWAYTDSLALSLTLATFACLLLLARRPRSAWAWAALALALVATYHTRPSTLFLVGLVPVLAVVLRACREAASPRRLARWGMAVAVATLVPYLAFATLRWAVVGHFGLVSFGGFNLIGVAANFIDDEVVQALEGEPKILARRILTERNQRGWEPMRAVGDPQPYFEQYNPNVWKIAVPVTTRRVHRLLATGAYPVRPPPPEAAAESALGRRQYWLAHNHLLTDLSRRIIRLEPYLYLNWVRKAWGYGLGQLLDDAWLLWPLALLVVSLSVLALLGAGGRRPDPDADAAGRAQTAGRALLGLLIVALVYFGCYMVLVSMVAYPIPRYTIACTFLLPPAVCALLFESWRQIARRLAAG